MPRLRRHRVNMTAAAISASPAIPQATPMPALAPVLRLDCAAAVPVTAGEEFVLDVIKVLLVVVVAEVGAGDIVLVVLCATLAIAVQLCG